MAETGLLDRVGRLTMYEERAMDTAIDEQELGVSQDVIARHGAGLSQTSTKYKHAHTHTRDVVSS